MDLTDEEKFSLQVSESEHNTRVRMIYFEMKRCKKCNPKKTVDFRSCWPHAEKMSEVANEDR